MTTLQRLILATIAGCMGSLLLALLVRRCFRLCWSFLLYCTAVLAGNALFAWRPDLLIWTYWLFNELLHTVLKFTLAAEVGWRIFGPLPGARSALASALLLVSLVTLWAVLATDTHVAVNMLAVTTMTRVNHGTAWIFGAILAAKLYFRLPVHPLHQAILRGLVPFLMIFTVGLGLMETYGAAGRWLAAYGNGPVYILLLVYWNVVVWRKADDPQVPPEVMQKLQPWR